MSAGELGGELLKSVSRSFYLSVRVLPASIRSPIGLAYLLARASDTIADTVEVPAASRLEHLSAFAAMVETGNTIGLKRLQREISPAHEGEQRLIANLNGCFRWLNSLPNADSIEVRDVLAKIIRGQTLDIQRFPGSSSDPSGISTLQTAEELEEYAYLVAGCVGEFWTRICIIHLPAYSSMESAELCGLGKDFGKALQLVNILRDLPADLREGRCYLPADDLRKRGIDPESILATPAETQPIFDEWLSRASQLLDAGRKYVRAIRSPRVRIACYLPWYLGEKTLALLRVHPPLTTSEEVKVSRATVRAALLRAPIIAFSNLPLRG